MRKTILFALALMCAASSALAQAQAPRVTDQDIADAYTYLLGRVLVIRQEQIDRKAPGFAYNVIKYNPLG
jgi:hypothetical protein